MDHTYIFKILNFVFVIIFLYIIYKNHSHDVYDVAKITARIEWDKMLKIKSDVVESYTVLNVWFF